MSPATKNKCSILVLLSLGFSLLRMPTETVCVEVKDQHLCLRVLRDKTDQKRGFQLVENLYPNEGLLYILSDKKKPNFWMKDVIQHLDIVFIDDHGHVLETVHAHPHRSDVITPPTNTMYAIELLGGRAEQLNLVKGSKLLLNIISEPNGALFAGD